MDDANRAEIAIQREIEARIKAARGVPFPRRTHCIDCGDFLDEHRRERGICVECQDRREREAMVMGARYRDE